MNAMEGRLAAAMEDVTARAALAWLEDEPVALAFLDAQLGVVWRNVRAADLLDCGGAVTLRDGRLWLGDPALHEAFTIRLRQSERPFTWCVPLAGQGEHLLLRVRRVACDGGPLFGLRLTRATASGGSATYEGLDLAYALTRAEMRVLEGILGGVVADQLARELGVAIGTVRTHIRNIYGKLGVGCREELFARAQPFRV